VKIVFAAAEMRPFAATGGLAEVVQSLSIALAHLGHEVKVFLPFYQSAKKENFEFKKITSSLRVPVGKNKEHGSLFSTSYQGVEIFFIEQPFYFNRPHFYGNSTGDYDDNDRRFIFFSRGVLESLSYLNFAPDIIHCHDWQAGITPAFLKLIYGKRKIFNRTRTVFSIHNLAYQGNFPKESFALTGFNDSEYRWDRLEFWDSISFLKAGLVYSDLLTTVSAEYAEEIQTEENGCGMEDILKTRSKDLKGILNGINLGKWNPSKDPELFSPFSASHTEGKAKNKEAFQKTLGLKVDKDALMIGFVGRLVDQKGLDLILPLLPEFLKMKIQFVFLGKGSVKYENLLKEIDKKTPGQLSLHLRYDPALAKQIFASSDAYLMPSFFEPCGLAQMISMRYSTVPLVRATGGLKETVRDFDEKTGQGNGIVFNNYSQKDLGVAIKRLEKLFREKATWAKIQANCFKSDFSWAKQARKYEDVYSKLLKSN